MRVSHPSEPVRIAVRQTDWLPTLEKELRFRVGWVDEAVSPFAAKPRLGQAEPQIQGEAFCPEKTAA
jgi:hypothetical protein